MNISLILFLLIITNLFGAVVGIIFYYPQIIVANPIFWIFIPDCPIYVFLIVLFYFKSIKSDFIKAIGVIGLIKYGAWTIFALVYYSNFFLHNWFWWLLIVEHICMTLQAALFIKEFDKKYLIATISWFLFNDFIDYIIGMHPLLPSKELEVIAICAVALSLLIPLMIHAHGKRIEENVLVKKMKTLLEL